MALTPRDDHSKLEPNPKATVTPPKATTTTVGEDPQIVEFDFDPEVKKQLSEGGSYLPHRRADAEEFAKAYVPPGPAPMGADSVGGASGGIPVPATPPETPVAATKASTK